MNRLLTAVAVLAFCTCTGASPDFTSATVSIDEYVDGKPVAEYVNRWWQWTFTMPPELSPVRDTSGEHCDVGQSGDVWYLAGGYGSSTIRRKCTIPYGRHLFFPVINMVYFPRYEASTFTCESAKTLAALNNDQLLDIFVELNGVSAWNPASTRIASGDCFDVLGAVPREYNPPVLFPSATDGYWVMLKPLERGTHRLVFRAVYGRENGAYGKMAQDIEYDLIIE